MHIILSRWKPKYLPGLAMTVRLPSRARRELGEEERLHRIERAPRREWLMTAESINWMSGQLLRGLNCTAVIKQSAHYVLKWVKNELSAWRPSSDSDCIHCFTSFIAAEAPCASLQLRQTPRHQKTPLLSLPEGSLPPSIFKFVYV